MRFGSYLLTASTAVLAVAAPTSEKKKRVSKFQWFGVNESGAEFGNTNLPGTLGKDYTWPVTSTIDTLASNGLNIFRIPFMMERLIPTLTGTPDATYLAALTKIVNYITVTKGLSAIIDPHNFGRFNGAIITDTAGFQTWWKTVATSFANNSKVIFDCNNEFHDMDQSLVKSLNQGCIDGVRAAGATSQYIFVEGNSYSGAWTWVSSGNGASLVDLKDPQNKIIYEMHQYLDSDGSGTAASCVSATIGSERVKAATEWLKANGKVGILGEFAGGANTQCQSAVTDLLTYLGANTDVWKGALWWGGGPWWADYIFSFEPPSGTGYSYYMSKLSSLI